MFEKEAKKWVKEHTEIEYKASYGEFPKEPSAIKSFKAGAEFGYNKANEWHYVKNGDLPTKELEGKQLLVRIRNYTENFISAYYMLDLYYSKNGKRFYSDTDCNYPIDIGDVIAWKEIVLPKEIENA